MAARNVQQDRQDGVQIMSIFGQNPHIDPRRPLLKALEMFGVADPESWLKQQEAPIPAIVVENLKRVFDPNLVDYVVKMSQQQDPQLAQEGPSSEDVGQMMGQQQEVPA